MSPLPPYAELHCLSNFSFLRGASHAEELMSQAKELGYAALAITDECSLAGVVRAHTAVKKIGGGIKLLIGAEFALDCGLRLVVIARSRAGYGRLSRLITRGRRKAEKGSYSLSRADVEEFLAQDPGARSPCGCPPTTTPMDREPGSRGCSPAAPGSRWSCCATVTIANTSTGAGASARVTAFRCAAAGDVHMHVRERRALQDALTAVRHGVSVAQAGTRLFPNGERHLRERERLAKLYPPNSSPRP
jgi:error-prone DNA polymerase